MKNLYKFLAEENAKRKKYFENFLFYGKKLKKISEKFLPNPKIIIFGSAITGKYRPNSDLDVLIISNHSFSDIFEQSKIKIKILHYFPDSPFELHLVTPAQYQNWYRKFIGKNYLRIL